MVQRCLVVILLLTVFLEGCAGELGQVTPGPGAGHTEAELLAEKGEPQKILPDPQGGKIYVYQRERLEHLAIMERGAYAMREETDYYLDPQGVISKVEYYPSGKRKFLIPSTGSQTTVAAAPEAVPAVTAAPGARETAPVPPPAVPVATKAPAAQTASSPATPKEVGAASTCLELKMSKDEVQRLLGMPDRTEGLLVGGKSVVVWFYTMEDRRGRPVSTPLVFKEGRLAGWGETSYQQVRRESPSGKQ